MTIEGVVVGDYPGNDIDNDIDGFYMQEEDDDADANPATSEGIFVYLPSNTPNVTERDRVRVTGTATEFQNQTQIGSVTQVQICSSDNTVTPATVSLPVADSTFLERYEGMLVQFNQVLYVTEYFQYDRFGEVVLSSGDRLFQPTHLAEPGAPANAIQTSNDLNRIIIDDRENDQNPETLFFPPPAFALNNTFRGGDMVTNLGGVLVFSWGGNSASPNAYRVRPSTLVPELDVESANPREAAPTIPGSTLTVASFNVLNYFTTLDERGAETPLEFERQTTKIITALLQLDADVVGLIEIENHPADEALDDLVSRLNANTPGLYAAINTGVIGSDEIKVALIYKPASVTPVGSPAVLDNVDPFNRNTRPPLAQTFEQNSNGAQFTVVVNHFKSKSSTGCPTGSDPNANAGDGQGCWNEDRVLAATELLAWLATDPTGSGDTDILIIGDLNAYAMEDPIDVLKAGGYTDLLNFFKGADAYSFLFGGQFGYLDYAMGTSSIVSQVVGVEEWHINADEPDVLDYNTNFKPQSQIDLYEPNAFRSSDHDPLLVGLNLLPVEVPVPDFDGDGKGDILWRNTSDGINDIWLMDGATTTAFGRLIPIPALDRKVFGAGDFNADGKADIFWRNMSNGANVIWAMDGTTIVEARALISVPNLNQVIVGTGDFNRDGNIDILWRNQNTGSNTLWLLDDLRRTSVVLPARTDTRQEVVAVADFDGDEDADMLWRNRNTGAVSIWLLENNTIVTESSLPIPSLDFAAVGAGDFDGDGKFDVLWRNQATGQSYLWLMDGASRTRVNLPTLPNLANKVAGLNDIDGDGDTDILWRNTVGGANFVWFMDNAIRTGADLLARGDTAFQMVGMNVNNYDDSGDIGPAFAGDDDIWGIEPSATLVAEAPAIDEVLSEAPLADMVEGPVIVDELLVQTQRVFLPIVMR
ncbi:MAG: ExeM/NucH family extracellular endonuclease [Chloroflexaceae bacterium]|nr:ExeM/NucH family extracellular endonuclease [Chloroflexaceae bacterium]